MATADENISRIERMINEQYTSLINTDFAGMDPAELMRKLGENIKELSKYEARELVYIRALDEVRALKKTTQLDIRELKYLLKEYKKSPFSPQKAYFASRPN
jgi:hypothetical protein